MPLPSFFRPGTIRRLELLADALPTTIFRHSTHALGVVEAIELARALDQRPPHLALYGIEGQNFEAGAGLSPDVEKAGRDVVTRIADQVCARSPDL